MNKVVFIIVLLLLPVILVFSQGEITDVDKIYAKNETSLAFSIKSNGLGLDYRFAKRIDAFKKHIFDVDFAIIKHPKEIKTVNNTFESQKRFVFGKINEAWSFNIGYGRQHEKYSKYDKGSISIRYFVSGGATFVFLKPIYYEMANFWYYDTAANIAYYYKTIEKFNPTIHNSGDVYAKAAFKMGLNETKVVPGVFLKGGISFEFSNTDTLVRAIEGGFIIHGLIKKASIMSSDELPSTKFNVFDNPQYGLALFVSYRFGSVLDGKKKLFRRIKQGSKSVKQVPPEFDDY